MSASDLFLQQLINALTIGSIYALIALGYTMVYGIIQLINFAHGEVFMVGAYFLSSNLSAPIPSQKSFEETFAPVAQMDRATAF